MARPSTEPWLTVFVDGPPQGKGRARSFRTETGIGHFTPKKTKSYEKLIKQEAMLAMRQAGKRRLDRLVEVRVEIGAYMIDPMSKPDIDNIEKSVLDAFNKMVWRDDAQVIDLHSRKLQHDRPQLVIDIYI